MNNHEYSFMFTSYSFTVSGESGGVFMNEGLRGPFVKCSLHIHSRRKFGEGLTLIACLASTSSISSPMSHESHMARRNHLRHPKSPIVPRTGPTRFDAWSSWGGRPERTLGGHPHVLGRHVVAWSTVYTPCKKGCSGIQKITGGLGSLSIW